jgi:plastocyanin
MRTRTALTALALGASLALAACGGGSTSGTTGTTDGGTADSATSVSLVGTDSLKFDKTELSVAAGEEVTVTLTAEGSVAHNFVIEELDDEMVVEVDGGATDSGTITLEAGTYTYYCDIVGHRQSGMEGTITAG